MMSRNGSRSLRRSLGRKLNRCLNRRCTHSITRRLVRARAGDSLGYLCSLLEQLLRSANRLAQNDPHLFGPRAREYYLDTLRLQGEERLIEEALRKTYGPVKPGEPRHISTLWTDRYFPPPERRKLFRKWFHEQYPSP